VLHELNPNDTDWGAWYEQRRRALIDASVHDSNFWYSFWVTLGLIVTGSAWVKSLRDRTRQTHIMGDQMNKVRDYAAYSRRVAKEAIRRYNTHIELCNRAIEASEPGHSTVLGGNSAAASLRTEIAEAKQQISSLDGDKRRLEAEVAQKTSVIADLSLRVDALSSQLGGSGQNATPRDVSTASHPELVRHINTLQQQLLAEREKNKRLKGGG
jgi:acyl transferase domain-containing protein